MTEPGKAVRLAVIDMQNVFGDPTSPWFTPRFAEVVQPITDLVDAFTTFGQGVTFTRFVAPAVPQGAWRSYYQRWPFALQPAQSPIYRLVEEFEGRSCPTVDATTFGKWDAGLDAQVPSGELVIAGVSTDCCVISTALAAADAGVHVQVVGDACAGVDDDSHRQALHVMGLYGPLIEVVSREQVIDQLGQDHSPT
ncbi:MAG: hypothetical protein QOD87_1937 [Pseudonocardiales bacterium]|jgi:nicotinamidase-related amidase|nr:hypothetical protein [Pseudonocardiales bacterium]